MKKRLFSIAFVLVFVVFAKAIVPPTNEEKKTINTKTSKVSWKAYKVAGSHNGSIALKSGAFYFYNGLLTGGEFVVDMTTISTEDLKGGDKQKLDGHLNSEDFFDTANHGTSTLKFKEVISFSSRKNSYQIKAKLTIKGITNLITFNLLVNEDTATANLKVDRTKYDVKYGSTLFGAAADKAIYDEFDLNVNLEFNQD